MLFWCNTIPEETATNSMICDCFYSGLNPVKMTVFSGTRHRELSTGLHVCCESILKITGLDLQVTVVPIRVPIWRTGFLTAKKDGILINQPKTTLPTKSTTAHMYWYHPECLEGTTVADLTVASSTKTPNSWCCLNRPKLNRAKSLIIISLKPLSM